MEKMDYWRLCDELSVVQATLLILNINPGEYLYVMDWAVHERPENFSAVLSALVNAIHGGRLPATINKVVKQKYDITTEDLIECELDEVDVEKTTVFVEDLKTWLWGRGVKTGFFFPKAEDAPDYLDKSNKSYAPKLAAAIGAWEAINAKPELISGITVKQALQKWLRQNADQFGLTKDDGKPNEQGIEEIAKISNWDSKGGAPKTPG